MTVFLFERIQDKLLELNSKLIEQGFIEQGLSLYVRLFRSQFDELEEGSNYAFPFPCVFIEFITDLISNQGNGSQVYENLTVKLHIGSIEFDAMDGNMDQNLNIIRLKELIFQHMNGFFPQSSVSDMFVLTSPMIRVNEEMHSKHDQVSVYTQEYRLNYHDTTLLNPIGGIMKDPVTDLDLTVRKVVSFE